MDSSVRNVLSESRDCPPRRSKSPNVKISKLPAPVAILPILGLTACGADGGGSGQGPTAGPTPPPPPPAPPPPPPPTSTQSGRFLAQAGMGSSAADIASVTAKGFDGWLSDQFNKPRATSFWDWLIANGHGTMADVFTQNGFDAAIWSQLITGEDQLRQRVGAALYSIFVVKIDDTEVYWRQFSTAAYMDILWDNAFGNFRTLLEKITLSPAMGWYLSLANNKKADANGSVPDENFAREIMQLFTIGLYQLNPDGTQKLANGKPIETYSLSDVTGLARALTGWFYTGFFARGGPDHVRLPMIYDVGAHEMGEAKFLGTTIPAGTAGPDSLKIVLDTLFAHPNVAPFISKQLIQKLVTSNPTPAYVQRVASIFENNGSGVRGDLRAVVRAILLDSDARNDAAALASTSFGKLREPMMRFTAWARAFGAKSPSNAWKIGDNSGTTGFLSQQLGRSPSVFSFFRPGYVPPNSAVATQNMVAPEFQIVNEQSTVLYITFMHKSLRDGWGDFKADYSEYVAKAADSQALLDLINLRLAANQVSAATLAQIKMAVDSIPTTTPADLLNRVYVATLAIMASPEFLILK